MHTSDYRELIHRLFPRLTGGIRWGLERTEALLRMAGDPHRSFAALHVGGTNGKGSVAASLASVLQQTGRKVGLYSSPHLTSYRERVRINGEPISEAALMAVATELWPALEDADASFFEATTVLAFTAMARAGVDLAVVEVGLGGRLDATNVISPIVSLITNIALDHAEYLGSTVTEIAGEKAGIIKPHVPLVTAETQSEPLAVFAERCAALHAPLHVLPPVRSASMSLQGIQFSTDTHSWGRVALRSPLVGMHQVHNAALAVAALDLIAPACDISANALVEGLGRVVWPGRFQIVRNDPTWVFDVAHNEAGVLALADTFAGLPFPRPVVLLVGILGDKDWARMLPPLFRLADQIVLTVPPSAPRHRAWDPEAVSQALETEMLIVEPDFEQALARVQQLVHPAGTVLVTGSFHTVGDAQASLGWAEMEPDFPLQHNIFRG